MKYENFSKIPDDGKYKELCERGNRFRMAEKRPAWWAPTSRRLYRLVFRQWRRLMALNYIGLDEIPGESEGCLSGTNPQSEPFLRLSVPGRSYARPVCMYGRMFMCLHVCTHRCMDGNVEGACRTDARRGHSVIFDGCLPFLTLFAGKPYSFYVFYNCCHYLTSLPPLLRLILA